MVGKGFVSTEEGGGQRRVAIVCTRRTHLQERNDVGDQTETGDDALRPRSPPLGSSSYTIRRRVPEIGVCKRSLQSESKLSSRTGAPTSSQSVTVVVVVAASSFEN